MDHFDDILQLVRVGGPSVRDHHADSGDPRPVPHVLVILLQHHLDGLVGVGVPPDPRESPDGPLEIVQPEVIVKLDVEIGVIAKRDDRHPGLVKVQDGNDLGHKVQLLLEVLGGSQTPGTVQDEDQVHHFTP